VNGQPGDSGLECEAEKANEAKIDKRETWTDDQMRHLEAKAVVM